MLLTQLIFSSTMKYFKRKNLNLNKIVKHFREEINVCKSKQIQIYNFARKVMRLLLAIYHNLYMYVDHNALIKAFIIGGRLVCA